MADDITRFGLRFAGSTSAHGRMWEADGKKRVKTISEPAPEDAVAKHLAGDGPYLGVIPIRTDGTVYFGAIDIDDDGVDHHELEARVVAHKLPLVVCRSKSGGAHLYCFTSEPVTAGTMVDALKKFRSLMGYEKNANGTPVEIFPKQTKLEPGQVGNWINLPYYAAATTNRYAVTGGRHLTLAEFLDHADRRAVTLKALLTWGDPALGPFVDGPPCLQSLHQLHFPAGGRNNGLFNVGVFYKLSRPSDWEEALRQYNAEQLEEPISEYELAGIIRNLTRTSYCYTCSQHPIVEYCKKKPCTKQVFGIGHFIKERKLAALPEMTNLVKINTDPPRYRLQVNAKMVSCSLQELIRFAMFKERVAADTDIILPDLKRHEWDDIVRGLMDTKIDEEAPAEAGARGLLETYLNDFLQLRLRSSSLDDVALGRPATDPIDHRVYFKATAFQDFLARRNFRRYQENELYTVLRESVKLTYVTRTIKGVQLNLWAVDEPKDDQHDAFEYPAGRHPQPNY